MSVHLYPAFRYTDLTGGSFSLGVVEQPSTINFTVTLNTAQLNSFVDFSSISASVQDFGAALAAALNSGSSGAGGYGSGYSVSWSAANLTWTISHASNFDLDPTGTQGTREVLGMSNNGTWTGGNSYTSDVAPWYQMISVSDDLILPSEDFEGEVASAQAWNRNGAGRAFTMGEVPTFMAFELSHEPPAAVFSRRAATSGLVKAWTWQEFWGHVRCDRDFLVVDTLDSTVCRFVEEWATFDRDKRRRHIASNDSWWRLFFQTYVRGRL